LLEVALNIIIHPPALNDLWPLSMV
jgi:hypothetical protein